MTQDPEGHYTWMSHGDSYIIVEVPEYALSRWEQRYANFVLTEKPGFFPYNNAPGNLRLRSMDYTLEVLEGWGFGSGAPGEETIWHRFAQGLATNPQFLVAVGQLGADSLQDVTAFGLARVKSSLYGFGGRTVGPRVRVGTDVLPDESGMIGPETPPLPNGASTFADPDVAPLNGHYHELPAGTELPDGLAVVADGSDVMAGSPHPPTHHTIYPTRRMHFSEFIELYLGMEWIYGGKK